MTTKKFVQGLIVTVALCLSATAGRAQNDRFFLLGSGSSLNDNRSFTEGYIPYSTSYATGGGAILGVELPLKKSKTFGVEVSYGLTQNNLKLANLSYSYKPTTAYGLRDNRFSLDLVAHAPGSYHGVHPYVVFGVEYDDFSPTSAAQTLATKIGFAFEPTAKFSSQGNGGFNLGGGLDHKLTTRLGLRLDIRYHITGSPTFGLPTSQPSTVGLAWFPATGSSHIIVYSIGIVYMFGKEGP
jgi:opacity protein-like surface antigen